MIEDGRGSVSYSELVVLGLVGLMATFVRLAADPPRSLARMLWLGVGGLGMATGGWLVAKAAGLDGWYALAMAWLFGAMGSEATLPLLRKWLEDKLGLVTPRQQPREGEGNGNEPGSRG